MAGATVRLRATRFGLALALLLLWAVPFAWSVTGVLPSLFHSAAWSSLVQDPQWLPAWGMSLWTGMASFLLALSGAAWLVGASFTGRHGQRLQMWLTPMLAIPHAAFAIGVLALIAPSGWIVRALSPWASGFTAPPPWATTQDPWGLGLILVLALKEIPFLAWAASAQLQRADVRQRLQRELILAQTMGYSAMQAWWCIGWPQLRPMLRAPLLAVLAYSVTVVDVALLIGPATPPTLSVLAWQWLQDADTAVNAQGAAAAWLLAATVVLCALLLHVLSHTRVRRQRRIPLVVLPLLIVTYGSVVVALLLGSVVGNGPFPQMVPDHWSTDAWQSVAASAPTLGSTLVLALTSSSATLVWAVAWLECSPPAWQRLYLRWSLVPLVLPAVLWVIGLHRMALDWNLDGSPSGVWLAHTLCCLPYVLLALQEPYQAFDVRAQWVASSLGRGPAAFLWHVKWPLLRPALAASFAVGFAVSVAQYLPTLYIGAGRVATITTEAVNLGAGGQRALAAAYACLQFLLPVCCFGVSALLARPRDFARHNQAAL